MSSKTKWYHTVTPWKEVVGVRMCMQELVPLGGIAKTVCDTTRSRIMAGEALHKYVGSVEKDCEEEFVPFSVIREDVRRILGMVETTDGANTKKRDRSDDAEQEQPSKKAKTTSSSSGPDLTEQDKTAATTQALINHAVTAATTSGSGKDKQTAKKSDKEKEKAKKTSSKPDKNNSGELEKLDLYELISLKNNSYFDTITKRFKEKHPGYANLTKIIFEILGRGTVELVRKLREYLNKKDIGYVSNEYYIDIQNTIHPEKVIVGDAAKTMESYAYYPSTYTAIVNTILEILNSYIKREDVKTKTSVTSSKSKTSKESTVAAATTTTTTATASSTNTGTKKTSTKNDSTKNKKEVSNVEKDIVSQVIKSGVDAWKNINNKYKYKDAVLVALAKKADMEDLKKILTDKKNKARDKIPFVVAVLSRFPELYTACTYRIRKMLTITRYVVKKRPELFSEVPAHAKRDPQTASYAVAIIPDMIKLVPESDRVEIRNAAEKIRREKGIKDTSKSTSDTAISSSNAVNIPTPSTNNNKKVIEDITEYDVMIIDNNNNNNNSSSTNTTTTTTTTPKASTSNSATTSYSRMHNNVELIDLDEIEDSNDEVEQIVKDSIRIKQEYDNEDDSAQVDPNSIPEEIRRALNRKNSILLAGLKINDVLLDKIAEYIQQKRRSYCFIDLSNNNISDTGLAAFFEKVEFVPSETFSNALLLSNNKLTDKSVIEIHDWFINIITREYDDKDRKEGSVIGHIDIRNNGFTNGGIARLVGYCETFPGYDNTKDTNGKFRKGKSIRRFTISALQSNSEDDYTRYTNICDLLKGTIMKQDRGINRYVVERGCLVYPDSISLGVDDGDITLDQQTNKLTINTPLTHSIIGYIPNFIKEKGLKNIDITLTPNTAFNGDLIKHLSGIHINHLDVSNCPLFNVDMENLKKLKANKITVYGCPISDKGVLEITSSETIGIVMFGYAHITNDVKSIVSNRWTRVNIEMTDDDDDDDDANHSDDDNNDENIL